MCGKPPAFREIVVDKLRLRLILSARWSLAERKLCVLAGKAEPFRTSDGKAVNGKSEIQSRIAYADL
jgi:hypothetical protein